MSLALSNSRLLLEYDTEEETANSQQIGARYYEGIRASMEASASRWRGCKRKAAGTAGTAVRSLFCPQRSWQCLGNVTEVRKDLPLFFRTRT